MSQTTFGVHAYWRVSSTLVNFISFAALQFRDETGTLIPTSGGTALESGHFSTSDSSKLFDGTDATHWESLNDRAGWAGYHFASAVTVMQVGIQKHSGDAPGPNFLVQYSDDGQIWGDAGFIDLALVTTNDVMRWFDLIGALAEELR